MQNGLMSTALDHRFANRLMEMLAIPAFVLDADCRVIIWNRACARLTGVPAEEVLGTRGHRRGFYAEERPTLADLVIQQRMADLADLYPRHSSPCEQKLSAENWCDLPRIGRRRYLAADASPIAADDGSLVAVVETLRDITEEKAAHMALEQMATRDSLTGLANRRCFDDTLAAEWQRAQRQRLPLSLLMVDVDHFKRYNDVHGHLGGDDCLRRVATAVASEMRANDLVARYGGEEFGVILPNQDLNGAAAVAERIRTRVERLRNGITVSIGAASMLAESASEPSMLLAVADAALYRAKRQGRNRIATPVAEPA
jgi:diguanylate cyclase (GGDEF)-like protein/PAS domain S-box-containing protein